MSSNKALCFLFLIWPMVEMHAQAPNFTEVAQSSGVNYTYGLTSFGQGISMYDFNKDGLDDITIPGSSNEEPSFYQSTGTGFVEVLIPSIGLPANIKKCILWVDYDNDGDLDLSVNSLGADLRLFRNNGSKSFSDISASAGFLEDPMYSFAGLWGDYDVDGHLDFYATQRDISSIENSRNRLYRNNGNGFFTNVTDIAMVADSQGLGFGASFTDFNRDGWPDIHIANDKYSSTNTMLKNLGNSTFETVSDPLTTGIRIDGMGLAAGDFDGNGFEDYYITNTPISSIDFGGNVLCQNNADETFIEVATDLGLKVYEIGWGCSWADFNNDGHLDLFVCNTGADQGIPNSMFINQGDGTFEEDTMSAIHSVPDKSFGCAVGDINNDGYPDIAVLNESPSHLVIWQNNGGSNNWIKIKLQGDESNYEGIGTNIEAYFGSQYCYRYTRCGTSYGSQDGREAMIGLGTATLIDSLVVTWPSGIVAQYYNLAVNQTHDLYESSTITSELEQRTGHEIQIHPNPSNGLVTIRGLDGTGTLLVIDISGKTVLMNDFECSKGTSKFFDLTRLPGGIYSLTVKSDKRLPTNHRLEILN